MAALVEILDDSSGEVECYLDPESEVFFGPVTEKEREVRKPLPRRTLHPCEITEISKRGMNFHEWEEFKEQVQRNQLNDEAIFEVFGEDDTTESFASCYTSRESDPKICEEMSRSNVSSLNQSLSELANGSNDKDISGVESLNDTWEIQERMLAFAERLERGEDIPELGICNSSNKTLDAHRDFKDLQSNAEDLEAGTDVVSHSFELIKSEVPFDREEEKENFLEGLLRVKKETVIETKHPQILPCMAVNREPKKELISDFIQDMEALSVAQFSTSQTPIKFPIPTRNLKLVTPSRIQYQTPVKTPRTGSQLLPTTPSQTNSSSRPASSIKQSSSVKQKQHFSTPSPVGMYIRSLPETILIENVRSSQKKKQILNVPSERPTMLAVKLEDGRWGTVKESVKPRCPPQPTPIPKDYKPVLPVVLHEAAATMISETPDESALPGTTGKIGQLLKRGVTPTVLKHQGRIQLSNSASRPSRIVEPTNTAKTERTRPDVLEVSVLETVSTPTHYRPQPRLVKSARK